MHKKKVSGKFYYYTTIRSPDGKTKSVYLGKSLKEARENLKKLTSDNGHRKFIPHYILIGVLFLFLIIFTKFSFTGYTTYGQRAVVFEVNKVASPNAFLVIDNISRGLPLKLSQNESGFYYDIKNLTLVLDQSEHSIKIIDNNNVIFSANVPAAYVGFKVTLSETGKQVTKAKQCFQEKLVQLPAEIGKPVEWIKKVKPICNETISVEIPELATNVSVIKIKNSVKEKVAFELKRNIVGMFLLKLTSMAVGSTKSYITIQNPENAEYEIHYFTPAPEMSVVTENFTDKIVLTSEIPYKNVKVSLPIEENFPQFIELWHNGLRESIKFYDENKNGLVEKVEWIADLNLREEYLLNRTPKQENVRIIVDRPPQEFSLQGKEFVKDKIITVVPFKEALALANQARVSLDVVYNLSLQDTVPLIRANLVHAIKINNKNVTGSTIGVCVLDTGIDDTHPDLADKIVDQHCFADNSNTTDGIGLCPNGLEEDTSADDDYGHGTLVSGIIAASPGIVGVAPGARIIAVKVCNMNGGCYTSDIIKGINYCIQHKDEYNISIITLSIGTSAVYSDTSSCETADPELTEAVNNATFHGIFIDASSGNGYSTSGISNPACIANVTSVGASTKQDHIDLYSNVHESLLDLIAPGSYINTTQANGSCALCGTTGYSDAYRGTSFAAPHVAGAAALLQHYNKLINNAYLSPKEIRYVLKETGVPVKDDLSATRTGLSFPRIDVYAAVDKLLKINATTNKAYNIFGSVTFNQSMDYELINYCFDLSWANITLFPRNECSKFNVSSKLEMFNLSYEFTPVILKDGKICDACFGISYSEGNLSFNVTSFSSYTLMANSNLTIWTSYAEVGKNVSFYANYTNITSSQIISDASCIVNVSGTVYDMNFDSGLNLFVKNLTFKDVGHYNYSVSCSRFGFENQSLTDVIFVNPMIITVCSIGCDFTNLEDAIKFANNSANYTLYINEAGNYSLNRSVYNLTSLYNMSAIVINASNVEIDCNFTLFSEEQKTGTWLSAINNFTLENCNVSNYNIAIHQEKNFGNLFNNTIKNCSYGLLLNLTAFTNITGNSFYNNGIAILTLDGNSTQYPEINSNMFSDNSLDFKKAWSLQVYVFNNDGPVENATVKIYDTNNTIVHEENTNASGYTSIFNLPEYYLNNSVFYNTTQYRVEAFKDFMGNYDEEFLLTRSYVDSEAIGINLSICLRLVPMTISTSARICRDNYVMTKKAGLSQVVIINGDDIVIDCDYSNFSLADNLEDYESTWGLWFFYTVGKNVTLKNCNVSTRYPLAAGSTCINHTYENNILPGIKIELASCSSGSLKIINNTIDAIFVYLEANNLGFVNNTCGSDKLYLYDSVGILKGNHFSGTTISANNESLEIINNTFLFSSISGNARILNNTFINSSAFGSEVLYNQFLNSIVSDDIYSTRFINISNNVFTGVHPFLHKAIELPHARGYVFNNTIIGAPGALYLISVENNCTIIKNIVKNGDSGVSIYYGGGNLVENNTFENLDYGIYTYAGKGNNSIKNNIVKNCTYGVYDYSSEGTNVLNNTFINCTAGVYGIGSSNITIFDNIINATEFGIVLRDAYVSRMLRFLNNISDVNKWRIMVNWSVKIFVRDQNDNAVSGATVEVYENDSSFIGNFTTGVKGGSSRIYLTEYVVNNSDDIINKTPHIITATYSGATNTTTILVNETLTTRQARNTIYIPFITPSAPSGTSGGGGGAAEEAEEVEEEEISPIVEEYKPKVYKFEDIKNKETTFHMGDKLSYKNYLLELKEISQDVVFEFGNVQYVVKSGENYLDIDKDGEYDLICKLLQISEDEALLVFDSLYKKPPQENITMPQPVQKEVVKWWVYVLILFGVILLIVFFFFLKKKLETIIKRKV